jgi:hypothetical protein
MILVYIYTHTPTYTHTHTYIYVYIPFQEWHCIQGRRMIYIYIYMYIYTHKYIYIHTFSGVALYLGKENDSCFKRGRGVNWGITFRTIFPSFCMAIPTGIKQKEPYICIHIYTYYSLSMYLFIYIFMYIKIYK